MSKENPNLVVFSKEYDFEGTKIKEIDMSGMENITARDMIYAGRALSNSGNTSTTPEMQLEYALTIASRATGTPVEFFYTLVPRDAFKVRGVVNRFFYGMG